MNRPELLIALSYDTDSDYFDASIAGASSPTPLLQWKGIERGIPQILQAVDGLRDSAGKPARMSWFVRADNQLKTIYGSYTYLLEKYASLWKSCASERKDEIAWHPHLYRMDGATWRQETDDELLSEILSECHASFASLGFSPKSTRIGDVYGSPGIMAALSRLGIRCDSTAMPGRKRIDGERIVDWESTPRLPYHPSLQDHRVPGTPSVSLLEVPLSMISTRASYDRAPLQRYVDLSFYNEAMKAGLVEAIRTAPLLVTITHPSTVLPEIAAQPHGLLSFSMNEFRKNLAFILEECERIGRPYRFVTLSECVDLNSQGFFHG